MDCAFTLWGTCFNPAPPSSGFAIFGFAEFLTALALLVVVFNSGDFLYKFRISVAALPMRSITFASAIIIGSGTLLTDLWFADRWYAPAWGVTRATIQAGFGALFLGTVLLWIWVAFIRPPTFSRWNYRHFHNALFHAVVRGSDTQLQVISAELAHSAGELVKLSTPRRRHRKGGGQEGLTKPDITQYANETLILIGNRKLCRNIVASSPGTAILFMHEMVKQEKWEAPLGVFACNITNEALINKDSILYHEDSLYNWDVVGRVQPFSRAMYGEYRLVEGLAAGARSPLDLDWRTAWEMDGQQFAAYCRITLLTFKGYVKGRHYHSHSYALFRALVIISGAGRDISKLEGAPLDTADEIQLERLKAAVQFVEEVLDLLAEVPDADIPPFKPHDQRYGGNSVFDHIAKLIYDLIHSASYLHGPPERAWWVHYNTIWGPIFSSRTETSAWKAIRRRVFRLLFDEIKRMERWPNYQGARILGFLLNVGGLSGAERKGFRSGEYALRRAVLDWTRRNYARLVLANSELAEYSLSGGISFEPANRRLVKTYAKGTRREPDREYLTVDDATVPLGEDETNEVPPDQVTKRTEIRPKQRKKPVTE